MPSTGNQNPVIEVAKERVRELLRLKRPFVWNATNLSPMLRENTVPEYAICHMVSDLIPPEAKEAHRVQWLCV